MSALPTLRTAATAATATAASSRAATTRPFSSTAVAMGVTKTILTEGSGPSPQKGQKVHMEYTGWLKDTKAPGMKGKQFDSSVGRGTFITPIGVGHVIKGWDEGVTQMKLGEKALLDISSDFAYGSQEFPNLIPPHSDLLFEVELKKIT